MTLFNSLVLNTSLFVLGLFGILVNRKNVLIILMAIELMLLAINMNFITFSAYLDDLVGQLFALFILTVAAAESATGLAILVSYYRVRGSISLEHGQILRG
jgi:NADH-quinone oxidoreductase subunit K|uniref:NADH dehydrogenase subunit 4L n=1 Tax=Heterosigma akashiwo TaxID=2829 RepID=D2Z254_HETAK|nr:NADH dehydrogenase subunit 4L [Heterosigma akashiwo]ACS27122.1 NADH dehydrogenase subunit 4L [Heterosigma akashiwo]ACS27161.1 NADH dehydrogenase subunit 4L [Heterosigma akashiwo]AOR08492.1 NADH dehydrogenase subunit 4L [Heterosigma akashiwo]AOT84790.1 NADH dehydrogenase subunit 4L [Heterosigma akashiwo]AOT84832.1 NADH dehydrogenase subunit 4L [Heterosigma akashiwo]|mmetsp:Transcript_25233/g.37903  ORF Transcript_25233/g.37903 Transcript_25233/m.37903 type:complete len:101 (-) Transcript_25233:402-704(-)